MVPTLGVGSKKKNVKSAVNYAACSNLNNVPRNETLSIELHVMKGGFTPSYTKQTFQ